MLIFICLVLHRYQKTVYCGIFLGGLNLMQKNISNSFKTSEFSGVQSSCDNWVVLNIQNIKYFSLILFLRCTVIKVLRYST